MLQGDQSWFIMQCFALMSSIMGKVIMAKSPIFACLTNYAAVLKQCYIGLTRLLPTRTSDDAVDTDDHKTDIEDEKEEEEEEVEGEYHSSRIIIGDETVEEVMNDELIPRDVE